MKVYVSQIMDSVSNSHLNTEKMTKATGKRKFVDDNNVLNDILTKRYKRFHFRIIYSQFYFYLQ